jgi:micrococcal nuclease
MLPPGSTVDLEPDVTPRDQYRRVLAYLWLDGRMLNWEMVRQGWAVPIVFPPNVQYVAALRAARDLARRERRGLWSVDGFRCEPAAHRAAKC